MKDREITITVVQPDVVWNDIQANLSNCSSIIEKNAGHTDLILLPEMFATGFTTDPGNFAEGMDGRTIRWMKEVSLKKGCAVAGSVIITDREHYFNRLVFVEPSGHIDFYDKRHLFRMEGEEIHYTPGIKRTIISLNGWRIALQICYDLRFPVWSRNVNDYDLLVYAANWPGKRSDVWNTLLKARALENQSYVVGVNRVGIDGNGISYRGESQVIGPKGNMLLNMGHGKNNSETVSLSMNELLEFREKFPVWLDRDRFSIEGSVQDL
ncbi:MAG: amidohydrolase [Bacteroidales bacterium]|nr:amidohydrolase [Bacteroidales bacterium]